MSVFNSLYASAYDLLYADKNYLDEASFVDKLVKAYAPNSRTLLDLGSGTGRHGLELMSLGYEVVGVELSNEMLAKANASLAGTTLKNDAHVLPVFCQGDIRGVRLERTFDVVTALFHVVSYQTSNVDLTAAFRTAANHVPHGGVFIFDFWYGPAVLTEKPSVKIKRLNGTGIELTRIAEPKMRFENNVVEVDYELFVRRSGESGYESFAEHHEMRYLFLPEIRWIAENTGWSFLESGEWMTRDTPSEKTWGVYAVLKRNTVVETC